MLVKGKTKLLLLGDPAHACLSGSTLSASIQISWAEPGEAMKMVALASIHILTSRRWKGQLQLLH